jgi:hypothetical protein
MAKREWVWAPARPKPGKPSAAEKAAVAAACEALIRDKIKPRFLPKIVPTEFNYPIDIYGAWHGGRYRFIQRYRSGFPENQGEEFESAYARIDYMGPGRFDVYWHRHTGQWCRLFQGMTLAEALSEIETNGVLYPL